MAVPLLEVRNLAKRFASRQGREPAPWVIRDLSFSVRDGEFLTIIGPSGSGKSTLLMVMTGLERPDTGSVVRPLSLPDHLCLSRAIPNQRPGAHMVMTVRRQNSPTPHQQTRLLTSPRQSSSVLESSSVLLGGSYA